MLSPADLIRLPYTSDLTPAALAYACQMLVYPECLKSPEIHKHLRKVIAQLAAQLAFRRHLSAQQVPHNISFDSQFTHPSQVSAIIGGRSCSLSNTFIMRREEVSRIHHDPACLLSYMAVFPSPDLYLQNHSEANLLIFTFVTGLVTPTQSEIKKALSAGEPVSMLYPLPAAWSLPSRWGSLGSIVLKSDCDRELTFKLGGCAEDRSLLIEEVNLPPRLRVQAQGNYYYLAFVQASELPTHRLGLHCPTLDQTLVIQAHQWGNIWVYGMDIILAGWMTRGEFRRCGRPHPPVQAGSSSANNPGKLLSVPVASLHPLEDLFARAKNWRSAQNAG